jgi:D-alanine-D-alanine ligase
MTASAVAMNKFITKQIAIANNVRVVPFLVHYASDSFPDYDEVTEKLGKTLFVKPGNAGSSVGVHKTTNQKELKEALNDAHTYDDLVLIETAIDARELEVAVIGNYPNIDVSEVSEIKPDREFYSFESKYDETSASEVVIPANISETITRELRETAANMFHLIGGSGLSRIDFFIDKENQDIYLNEINTIPGFTNISVYPKAWEHVGVSYAQLIERLIILALTK